MLDNLYLDIHANGKLEKIGNWTSGDIFVAGFPKSGNTWFQTLAAACLFGADPASAPDSIIQDLVPDVHYKRYFRRYSDRMVFKTHFLPKPEYRRVVLLLRDARDVMVSYHRYLQAKHCTQLDFAKLVVTGEGLFPCHWHEHVTAWLDNPYSAEMMIIRYEELLGDASSCLRSFCEFAGIEREDADLKWIAERSRFKKLRNKEQKQGLENWNHNGSFFRRGVAGSFRDEMPADVQELLMQQAGPAMKAAGYVSAAAA